MGFTQVGQHQRQNKRTIVPEVLLKSWWEFSAYLFFIGGKNQFGQSGTNCASVYIELTNYSSLQLQKSSQALKN